MYVSPAEGYAMAVFSILEGPPDLEDIDGQLPIMAVMTNRLRSSNWTEEFGPSIFDQLFAPGQFEVETKYGLDRGDFDSLDEAAQALADAKPGFSFEEARAQIIELLEAASGPAYQVAADSIGDSTGFRGNGETNDFTQESPYDDPNIGDRQPDSIQIEWPDGINPFF